MIIAIDGPVGVGKTSVAATVARQLGFLHIDSGAMYRALAWRCLENDLDPKDPQEMEKLALNTRIDLEPSPDGPQIFCEGFEITHQIRTPEVSSVASILSVHPAVRAILVESQRAMGHSNSVVMEGRDIGTVVFPDAHVKIYLDANLEARVQRRVLDYEARGIPCSWDEIRLDIIARDERDMNRLDGPLRKADDAVLIDTSNLSLDAVVRRVVELVREKLRKAKTSCNR